MTAPINDKGCTHDQDKNLAGQVSAWPRGSVHLCGIAAMGAEIDFLPQMFDKQLEEF